MPTLTIPEATWQGLAYKAAQQHRTVEQLVLPVLDHLATDPVSPTGPPPNETAAEWIARLNAWIASHPIREGVTLDDSRETMYAGPDGRGLW